jgi:hypothetical protein
MRIGGSGYNITKKLFYKKNFFLKFDFLPAFSRAEKSPAREKAVLAIFTWKSNFAKFSRFREKAAELTTHQYLRYSKKPFFL